jgi:hypothetical protein
MRMRPFILFGLSAFLLAACNGGNVTAPGPAEAPPAGAADPGAGGEAAAAGKPGAPIDIEYEVIGTPVVGQPVSIDLSVKSRRGNAPVKLRYNVLDTQSMSFPDTQAREVALAVGDREPAVRQVTIVPQREGRLYLNVTAEIETPDGALIKSIAIPVQVGSGGPAGQEPGGTLKQDASGEPVISLPADET